MRNRSATLFLAGFVMSITLAAQSQTFTTLASFGGTNGIYPDASLVQGLDGNFYGTTAYGGFENGSNGTVFKIDHNGKVTRLYSFCRLRNCADGRVPGASLVQSTDGNLYGITSSGGSLGSDGCGTFFKITRAGTLTTLHSFVGTDGCIPQGGLVHGASGNFFGTTQAGGANLSGTVFEITSTGSLTTLYSFCSLPNCADGKYPVAALMQSADGSFYGTTAVGGAGSGCSTTTFPDGCGTVFKITSAGTPTTVYSFCSLTNCADGNGPESSLVQGTDGNFYGTTSAGGSDCSPYGCGTAYEITASGSLSTLYNFCSAPNCSDGTIPDSIMRASDGNFYGETFAGGAGSGNTGTLFKLAPGGTFSTLHSFCSLTNCSDGGLPVGGLIQSTNGLFYGVTEQGGAGNSGTVFSFDIGLEPFVSFIGNPAKIGQRFGILGQGFTGTTGVSFNGVAAKFKVESDTFLITSVPAGATTGYVTVTTPGGTLTSNVPFRVIQ